MEKRTLKIFVVEDDAWYGQILLHHLGLNPDFQIELFTRGADLLKNIYRKPDIICMDYNLSDYNGDELLTKIFSIDKLMPIRQIYLYLS